ncbi:SDR family oxidoreductase [Paraburkholderia caledonica]|uniref:SDR family oxidoreductase n=1 Tax=Paraburkholderia caledonica TaxID=134536 RepID=UPI001FC943A6|nr:SDR family oxidoreductase [Paraburkholderia caledonica]
MNTARTILITGANKSIGYETARQLGRLGYRIWLGCRDVARGEAALKSLVAEGHDVRLLTIDVTRDESVRAAAARVRDEDGRLDVLINNAGIPGDPHAAPSQQPMENIRAVYETNVFGPIRVTQSFVPLLKSAGRGTVVMVSSRLGSMGWLSDPANQCYGVNILGYNSSKSALNAVALAFAKELASVGIKVDAVDPGYTATDFNNHSGYRTVKQAAAGIVWLATQNPIVPSGRFYFEQDQIPWCKIFCVPRMHARHCIPPHARRAALHFPSVVGYDRAILPPPAGVRCSSEVSGPRVSLGNNGADDERDARHLPYCGTTRGRSPMQEAAR